MESIASFYDGAKVLITGGLGFIGSNLARRLVELGADVWIVDALLPDTGANSINLEDVRHRMTIRVADLAAAEIGPLLPGSKVVFNLAGRLSHLGAMLDPLPDMASNVHAQVVFLEECRKHIPGARIVYASTRQIYGRPARCPVDESHPVRPIDVNGINKAAGERYHTLYHRVYGLQTVSLRLTNTFGPRMRIKDARHNFLGIWVRRLVEGGAFEVWGGQQQRDLTYVDDAVEAFLLAGACESALGGTFNIGGGPPLCLRALAECLVKIAGSGCFEVKSFPPEQLRIDIGDYFADDRLFRKATGWAPRTSLHDGLERTLAFFQDHLRDYV